jgi:hypothetical protein
MFFWNTLDLERKLQAFSFYYNRSRVHQSLNGSTPESAADLQSLPTAGPEPHGVRSPAARADHLFMRPQMGLPG